MHKKGGWRKVRAKSEKLGMFLGERCLFSWRKWQGKSERRKMQEYAIIKDKIGDSGYAEHSFKPILYIGLILINKAI